MILHVSRFTTLILCVLAAAVLTPLAFRIPWLWTPALIAGLLVLLGVRDLFQPRHSIQRNYPVIGHIRWFVELIRPELRLGLEPWTRSALSGTTRARWRNLSWVATPAGQPLVLQESDCTAGGWSFYRMGFVWRRLFEQLQLQL